MQPCSRVLLIKATERQKKMNAKGIIKEMANETTSKIKVSELCNEIYCKLKSMDIKCAIVNDRAIEVDGDTIWFQRNNKENCWKSFEVIDCEYAYI